MGKVAYIIPGFGESNKQKPYKQIAGFFSGRGIKPVPVEIKWKRRTMSDYVEQFMKACKHNENDEIYLLGFSFGAIISFIASPRIRPKKQILCSLSPYFKEDLPYIKNKWKKFIGKRRAEDLKKYSFNGISKNVKCKTLLLAGTEELKRTRLKRRVYNANKRLKNSRLLLIKNAKHKIGQKEYIDALRNVISSL